MSTPQERIAWQQSRERIAWHEAGHCVALMHEDVKFLFVTLAHEFDNNGKLKSVGRVQKEEWIIDNVDKTRKEIQYLLSGHFGEELFVGKDLSLDLSIGATDDKRQMSNVLHCIPDETERRLLYNWAYYRAKKIIQQNRPAVEALAKALLTAKDYTLSYDEIFAMNTFI